MYFNLISKILELHPRSSSSKDNEPGDAVRAVNAVLTCLDSLKRRYDDSYDNAIVIGFFIITTTVMFDIRYYSYYYFYYNYRYYNTYYQNHYIIIITLKITTNICSYLTTNNTYNTNIHFLISFIF